MPHKHKGITLTEILNEFNPTQMSNGQIRMKCPFSENHSDGSGKMSMFLSPEINAYHCFSCGAKGNLLKLLTSKFKLDFYQATELVRFSDYKKEKEEFDLDLMWEVKLPREFAKRGYTLDTIKHFKVGETKDGTIVIPYYEEFTTCSNLLGYQTRVYYPDRRVKNSKGFDKANYLYNMTNERRDYVVLVEGQSDVWRLYQYGYNAVALMGADISEAQIGMLSLYDKVYLALDNDEAGRRGTEIVNSLLGSHTEILLVPYSTKDVGEVSEEEWDNAFNNSTDYLTYSLEMTLNWDDYESFKKRIQKELRGRKYHL